MDRLCAGTSGCSYAEWVDAGVYPAGTHAAGMLPAYAEIFKATELNYTWYQMPKARSLERMAAQVPQGFKFSVKLTRTLTHEVDKTAWIRDVLMFRQGISPPGNHGQPFVHTGPTATLFYAHPGTANLSGSLTG